MGDSKISHMDKQGRIRIVRNCAARIMLSLTAWGLRYPRPDFFYTVGT
jgi:hypothetical protein